MKRVILGATAKLDNLEIGDAEIVKPQGREVLVRVCASSLNFHDYMVATGILPAASGRVPLSDGVGEVVECGSAVSELAVGNRVMGTFFPDWLAGPATAAKIAAMRGDQIDGFASEYITLSETALTRAPAYMNDHEAATLPCAALTAWRALVVEGQIKPGDTVLVEGTGGVSIFALQFAKMAGATVIATSSSQDKLDKLLSLGADHVVNYVENPQWGAEVRELTEGLGVNHVVEVVGGDMSQVALARRIDSKIYMVGALSRQPTQFAPSLLISGNSRIIGITVGSREHQIDMVRALEANPIKPVIQQIYDMTGIANAFRHLEARSHFGKICLTW